MKLRVAFVGFRHAHVLGLYRLLRDRDDVQIVAACEEDEATRAGLAEAGIEATHDNYARMLDEVPCEMVACGDYFSIRGTRLIQALERGMHVLSDKPICTSMDELNRICELSARGPRVGCMLDLRDLGPYIALHAMIRDGAVGDVHTVAFLGQHPLLYGKRPMWFFEPGKHGGSINDIAIHGIDIVPWLTGRSIAAITAARAWNAKLPQHPEFQDGAVLLMRLDNDGAVFGDVSYLSSDAHGYRMAPYWRFTISGTDGVIETNCSASTVTLWRHDHEEIVEQPIAPNRAGGYFEDFLRDIAGTPVEDGLTTARVLESTRIALLAQHAADTETFPIETVI